MKNNGQVSFYSSSDTEGKLILSISFEFDFSIDIWNDSFVLPKSVDCYIEGGMIISRTYL